MSDAYSSNVVFLVKFSANGAVTTMVDKLGTTLTGYGNSTIVTDAGALTGYYLSLDGASDYLTTPGANGLRLGPGDFTIDFGIKTSASHTSCIIDYWDSLTGSGWQVLLDSLGRLYFGNPGSVMSSNSSINDGARHHCQISRYGNTLYMHIDGTKQANTASMATNFSLNSPLLAIGAQVATRDASKDLAGYLDFVRITVGVARGAGAASITPPTLADLGLMIPVVAADSIEMNAYALRSGITGTDASDLAVFSSSAAGAPHGVVADGISLSSSILPQLMRGAAVAESISLSAAVASKATMQGVAVSTIAAGDAVAAGARLNASATDAIKLFEAEAMAGLIDEALSVWVANVATAAHSRYAQYGFNSFAKINGKHYGCKSDGIYELDGDKDGAAPIKWTVTLPETDFGASNLKRFESVYVGCKSTGQIVLKVVQDANNVYHYNVIPSGNDRRSARAVMGRGAVGRYWQLELASDTERAELDSIDYSFSIMSRRI